MEEKEVTYFIFISNIILIIYQMVCLLKKVHHPAMTTTNIVHLRLKVENAQEVLTT